MSETAIFKEHSCISLWGYYIKTILMNMNIEWRALKGTIMGAKAMKDLGNVGHFCMFLLLNELHMFAAAVCRTTHTVILHDIAISDHCLDMLFPSHTYGNSMSRQCYFHMCAMDASVTHFHVAFCNGEQSVCKCWNTELREEN